jgi:hypothetical protein
VFAKRILAPVLSIHGFSGSFKKELDLLGGCRVVILTKIGKIYSICSPYPSMLNMMENDEHDRLVAVMVRDAAGWRR